MTVRELIQELLHFDMDAEVTIIGNDDNSGGWESFTDISVVDNHKNFSGFAGEAEIHFQSENISLIDNGELTSMQERIEEFEEDN